MVLSIPNLGERFAAGAQTKGINIVLDSYSSLRHEENRWRGKAARAQKIQSEKDRPECTVKKQNAEAHVPAADLRAA